MKNTALIVLLSSGLIWVWGANEAKAQSGNKDLTSAEPQTVTLDPEFSQAESSVDNRGVFTNPHEPYASQRDIWIFKKLRDIHQDYIQDPTSLKFPGIQVSGSQVIIDPAVQPDLVMTTTGLLVLREYLGLDQADGSMMDYQRTRLIERGMSPETVDQFLIDLLNPDLEVNAFLNDESRNSKLEIWYKTLTQLDRMKGKVSDPASMAQERRELIGKAFNQVLESLFQRKLAYAEKILSLLPNRDRKILAFFALEITDSFNQVAYPVAQTAKEIADHDAWLEESRQKLIVEAKAKGFSAEEVKK